MELRQRRNARGFSLIEILVVITIIGILITVSGGAYMKYIAHADATKTRSFISELEIYAADYNDRRGDYPPSRLKFLGMATTGDDANEGIEAFVQAIFHKDYDGRRPDGTSELINSDGDEVNKPKSIFESAGLLEFKDAWNNPIIYIRHSDYNKTFSYKVEGNDGSDTIEVWALKNPTTGTFYRFESCQFVSVGPDGLFDTEDDVCNFERSFDEE